MIFFRNNSLVKHFQSKLDVQMFFQKFLWLWSLHRKLECLKLQNVHLLMTSVDIPSLLRFFKPSPNLFTIGETIRFIFVQSINLVDVKYRSATEHLFCPFWFQLETNHFMVTFFPIVKNFQNYPAAFFMTKNNLTFEHLLLFSPQSQLFCQPAKKSFQTPKHTTSINQWQNGNLAFIEGFHFHYIPHSTR